MKTDKTKNWTDSWKEQLDEYSVTPPPEVWEELSKELAPRRIPFRKRTIWWAAACITLLLCTFIGLQFLRPTTDLNNLASNKNIRLGANGSISNAKYCTLDKTGTTRHSPIL